MAVIWKIRTVLKSSGKLAVIWKIQTVLKSSGKLAVIWKNQDSFEIIWKIGNHLKNVDSFETSWKLGNQLKKIWISLKVLGQFKRFFCYTRKNFLGSNATLLPRFLGLCQFLTAVTFNMGP